MQGSVQIKVNTALCSRLKAAPTISSRQSVFQALATMDLFQNMHYTACCEDRKLTPLLPSTAAFGTAPWTPTHVVYHVLCTDRVDG
jgi:hypothetical protein